MSFNRMSFKQQETAHIAEGKCKRCFGEWAGTYRFCASSIKNAETSLCGKHDGIRKASETRRANNDRKARAENAAYLGMREAELRLRAEASNLAMFLSDKTGLTFWPLITKDGAQVALSTEDASKLLAHIEYLKDPPSNGYGPL